LQKSQKNLAGLCGLLVLSLAESAIHAQETAEPKPRLTLKLECRADSILSSQSLPILVHVVNESTKPIETRSDPSSWYPSGFEIYVSEDGKEFQKHVHVSEAVCGPAVPKRILKPQEEHVRQVVLSQSKESGPRGVFARPGKYRLKGRLWENSAFIDSPEISITVEKPTGKDAEAAAYLAEKELVKLLGPLADWIAGAWAVPKLKEFLSKYGDTAYAHEARLALMISLANSGGKSEGKEEQRKREAEIRALIPQSWDDCPRHLMPDLVYWTMKFAPDRKKLLEYAEILSEKCAWHPRYAEMKDEIEFLRRNP
jgi:hypothetical protein